MSILRIWLGIVLGVFVCTGAWASAVVESLTGSVRAGPSAAQARPLTLGERVNAGTTVVTGANSRVILRFDDGQATLLNDNTEFRIANYVFTPADPAKDSFVFELFSGALR